MAEAWTSDTLASDGDDAAARRFGRLRDRVGTHPLAPALEPLVASGTNGESPVPFDSAKTFVGPNGTYYDERWRWMEWRGKLDSWNWAPALSFGGWFAYRRLYGWAALSIVWLNALLAMTMTGGRLRLLAIAVVIVAVLTGRYANAIYRQSFRRAALRVGREQSDHGQRIETLRRAGGIDQIAVWLMAAVALASATGLAWVIRETVGVTFAW